MRARFLVTTSLICSVLVVGCTKSLVLSSTFSDRATAQLDRVIVYLEPYPTWEDGWRESLAKHIWSIFENHNVEARVVLLSELRLNQEQYIADQEAQFGPLYRLSIKQTYQYVGAIDKRPTVRFRLQLDHVETGLSLWRSQIETRPSQWMPMGKNQLAFVGKGLAPAVADELRRNGYLR